MSAVFFFFSFFKALTHPSIQNIGETFPAVRSAIMLAIICSVVLTVSEVVTELGVDVSPRCSLHVRQGEIIRSGNVSKNVTAVELAASAFFLKNLKFLDGVLPSVPASFPRTVNSQTCLPCLDARAQPPVLAGCKLRRGRTYRRGEMAVSVRTTNGPFGTITSAFRNGDTKYEGDGDLTRNGQFCAMFLVHADARDDANGTQTELTYFEYAD